MQIIKQERQQSKDMEEVERFISEYWNRVDKIIEQRQKVEEEVNKTNSEQIEENNQQNERKSEAIDYSENLMKLE